MASAGTAWLKISVDCLREQINSTSDFLEDSGALSVSVDVSDDGRTRVEALYDVKFAGLASVLDELEKFSREDENFEIFQTVLEDRDWVAESQKSLEPVEVSQNLRIVAPWHDIAGDDKSAVIINPGIAFGTGHHESTLLCARFLSGLSLEGCTVVDYGCGSGVLAISALRLGAAFAWGVDVDPQALVDSRKNAALNDVEHSYASCLPDQVPSELQADVVVANIQADALIDLAERLIRLTRPGGWLILSGILQSQIERIEEAYADQFEFYAEVMGQWAMLAGQRTEQSTTRQ